MAQTDVAICQCLLPSVTQVIQPSADVLGPLKVLEMLMLMVVIIGTRGDHCMRNNLHKANAGIHGDVLWNPRREIEREAQKEEIWTHSKRNVQLQ